MPAAHHITVSAICGNCAKIIGLIHPDDFVKRLSEWSGRISGPVSQCYHSKNFLTFRDIKYGPDCLRITDPHHKRIHAEFGCLEQEEGIPDAGIIYAPAVAEFIVRTAIPVKAGNILFKCGDNKDGCAFHILRIPRAEALPYPFKGFIPSRFHAEFCAKHQNVSHLPFC